MTNWFFQYLAQRRAKNRPAWPTPESLIIPQDDDATRVMTFEGIVNFRDIGGLATADGRRVRRGLVYRSGMLARATAADLAALQAMGLRTVCDVRSPFELAESPDRFPLSVSSYTNLPLIARENNLKRLFAFIFSPQTVSSMMPKVYRRLLDENAADYASWLRKVAQAEQLPTLLHCTAGKDRTGLGIALLLMLLGVPEEVIIADYSLSNTHFDDYIAYSHNTIRKAAEYGVSAEDMAPLFIAHPDTLRSALAYLREKHGTAEAYLTSVGGLEADVITTLRASLLE